MGELGEISRWGSDKPYMTDVNYLVVDCPKCKCSVAMYFDHKDLLPHCPICNATCIKFQSQRSFHGRFTTKEEYDRQQQIEKSVSDT